MLGDDHEIASRVEPEGDFSEAPVRTAYVQHNKEPKGIPAHAAYELALQGQLK